VSSTLLEKQFLQIKKCNDENPKRNYVSYTLGKTKFVARVCDHCFSETEEDLELETISKESFESFKLEVLNQ
jgi:hypothetical protein